MNVLQPTPKPEAEKPAEEPTKESNPVQPAEPKEPISKEPSTEEPKPNQPEEDILTRVSKFVSDNDPSKKTEPEIDSDMFNDAELKQKIDEVQDPEFKAQLIGLRKSALSGMNDKFRELAEMRKDLQAMKNEQSTTTNWTADKVQSLLNDPQFVRAAQQIAGEQPSSTGDPLEYADDGVKQVVSGLQKEINDLKAQSTQAIQAQNNAARQAEHQALSAKYADYNPQEMDTITADMISGKIQATAENLYWAVKGPDKVKAAYEMGRRDGQKGVDDKVNSSSLEGISANVSAPAVEPEKGESNSSFWARITAKNLAASKAKS